MKNLFISLLLLSCFVATNAQEFKKYPFKSGIIEYKIEGKTKGTEIMYWDDYGAKELHVRDTETKTFGQVDKSVEYMLYQGDYQYSWQEGQERGSKLENPVLSSWKENPDMTWDELCNNLFTNLGYEKIGTETVAGKKCDVWKGMSKSWIWKGLTIKTYAKMLGIKVDQTATKIDTDASVAASKFEIPQNIKFHDPFNEIDRAAQNEDDETIDMDNEDEETVSADSLGSQVKSLFKGLGRALSGEGDE